MASGSASEREWLFPVVAGHLWRRAAYRLHASLVYRWRHAGPVPDRLLIAPTDLRTSDPTVAPDIYAGRFVFAGDIVDADGYSVFEVEPPSAEWARQLHGFGWLRHLRASDMTVARPHARSLVDDWMRLQNRHDAAAWETGVVARRVMSWLAQTPLVLEGCDHAFYRRFMRAMTRQVRHLRRVAHDGPPGLPRLTVMIALAGAALSMSDQSRFARQAARWLDQELTRQVLPDGGHVSRNPGAILEILADLLPLRQAFSARGLQPSRPLVQAIDRMMPMLRFFRLGDGTFGRFNGMGDTATDLLATVLAYDDVRGAPVQNAPHSGYQRIEAGDTVILVDTGLAPPVPVAGEAHAGCLSFEMSVGRQRLVINCGVPGARFATLRRLARTSAAHSTVTLNDTSSCRFLSRAWARTLIGEPIVTGPSRVDVERRLDQDRPMLFARHDGYRLRFGIVHERRILPSTTGDRIDGIDGFTGPGGQPVGRGGRDSFAIRFHLHPTVKASRRRGGRTVELVLPDGETWEFETSASEAVLEESVLFSDSRTNRRSEQIVVYGRAHQQPAVRWQFRRTALGQRRARPAGEAARARPAGRGEET